MIWARPLTSDGPLAPALVLRAGVSAIELEATVERLALVTGLDDRARRALAKVAGPSWVGGSADAGVVRFSRRSAEGWASRLGLSSELGRALRRLLTIDAPVGPTAIGPRRFEWGSRTFVMGVVNVTPDSFSDGGRFASIEAAVGHAEALVAAGADLLDVGGESTRPGAAQVGVEEELARVVPVIEAMAVRFPLVPLSIDTSKPEVAKKAIAAGAHLVNDVTGLESDAMLEVIARSRVPVCAMHMQGTPRTMQHQPAYDDVVAEVLDVLEARLLRAEAAGIDRSRVLVDPGIGFGKTAEHNLFLLKHLLAFRLLRCPVLVGTSRKSFLGALTGGKAPEARDPATTASVAVISGGRGADVVRVHDVASAKDAVVVADAIARAGSGGRLYEARKLL